MTSPKIFEVTTVDGVTLSRHSRLDRAVAVIARLDGRARIFRHRTSAAGYVTDTVELTSWVKEVKL